MLGASDPSHPEIVAKFKDKFQKIDEIRVFVNNLELYNERLRDMSKDWKRSNDDLKIREERDGRTEATLDSKYIQSFEEGMEYYDDCIKNRMIASTMMSQMSSRSHTIYTIKIVLKLKGEDLCKAN